MKKQNVYDPLISKRQQFLLATQLVQAVLKIGLYTPILCVFLDYIDGADIIITTLLDDVIIAGEADE